MKAAITVCVLTIAVALVIEVMLIVFFYTLCKVIMIHKVIACIVWWVDINHLDLTHIGVLEQFQHFKIIALDIEVLGGVPIYALFLARAQRLATRCCRLALGSPFANPSKVVRFRLTVLHIFPKE